MVIICVFPGCQGHGNELAALVHGQQHLATEAVAIKRILRTVIKKENKIMASQDDINAATTAVEGEVADLSAKDDAIEAAQAALLAEIQTLQGNGVDTTALVAATADLLTAQGADDATVAALTAASQPTPPAE